MNFAGVIPDASEVKPVFVSPVGAFQLEEK